MLKPNWIGRRVSIRLAVSDRFADVVGDLLDLTDERGVVETRGGLVEVLLGDVAIAKLVPPSTGDELNLEAVAADGWRPAESEWLGGWLLRANFGFTRRANCVLPLRQPDRPLAEALDAARAWYAERGLPLAFQVPAESRRLLDAALGEQGWGLEEDIHVMAARLDAVQEIETDALVTPEPDPDFATLYRGGVGDAHANAILTRHDRAGFAAIHRDGELVAIGRAALDTDQHDVTWLGIFAVEVAAHARRQGLARQVMAALHAWGRDGGAARAYLQVSSSNAAAIALYESLGYYIHHDYRYRIDPAAATQTSSC
ncbi:MAG TPA: GNAT family N-acetyltransferase [Jatrophihabitans sp.]